MLTRSPLTIQHDAQQPEAGPSGVWQLSHIRCTGKLALLRNLFLFHPLNPVEVDGRHLDELRMFARTLHQKVATFWRKDVGIQRGQPARQGASEKPRNV